MAQILGSAKAEFFFDRLLDYFLAEENILFIKECGATIVRLPACSGAKGPGVRSKPAGLPEQSRPP
jgi:hypothetical protein